MRITLIVIALEPPRWFHIGARVTF